MFIGPNFSYKASKFLMVSLVIMVIMAVMEVMLVMVVMLVVVNMVVMVVRTGQDRTVTFKLGLTGNLQLAAYEILAMFDTIRI